METPTPEEIAKWDRWFAIEFNNRAWELAEQASRTTAEAEEMLHAAHASARHWARVGEELNFARADLLLGQVHALLGNGAQAMVYARRAYDYVTSNVTRRWELAFAHIVLANAARVMGDAALYREHYVQAGHLGNSIAYPVEQDIFARTFRQVPRPPNT